MIDKWKEISIQNSENWKQWWRWKNQNKSETKAKQKQKKSETKTKKSNIEHITYNIEQWTYNNEQKTNNKEQEEKKINKKKVFLEFVYLSDDEYENLKEKLWLKLTTELIDKLNNYIWSSWKKYKSHYYTILNRSKKESTSNHDYERQRQIESHRKKIAEQIQSFNSEQNENGSSPINEGWYNRRNEVWIT